MAPLPSATAVSTDDGLRDAGRVARAAVPPEAHPDLVLLERDPMAILSEQNAIHEPDLRMQRTLVDSFARSRGTAAVMATDLTRSRRRPPTSN